MPKTKQFTGKRKTSSPFDEERGVGAKGSHYPGSPKARERIREAVRKARKGYSSKKARERTQGLRGRYTKGIAAAEKRGQPENERLANIRVRIRALLGKQAAKHGVARGLPGEKTRATKTPSERQGFAKQTIQGLGLFGAGTRQTGQPQRVGASPRDRRLGLGGRYAGTPPRTPSRRRKKRSRFDV